MPAKTAISVRKQARIRELYDKDLLFATEIGRKLNLSRTAVKRVLSDLGIESRGTYRPLRVGMEFNSGQLRVTGSASATTGANGWLSTQVWVHCRCDGTNSDFIVEAFKLRSGNVKSCGCLQNCSPNYRPHPDRVWRRLLRTYLSNHSDFALCLEQLKYICILPCYYCGVLPANELKGRRHRMSTGIVVLRYSGIDEVVHGKKHVVGNVLPACIVCNWSKSNSCIKEWSGYIRVSSDKILQDAYCLGEKLKEIVNGPR